MLVCISEPRIQDSNDMVQLTTVIHFQNISRANQKEKQFALQVSTLGIVLADKTQIALLGWISVSSLLFSIMPLGVSRCSRNRGIKNSLLVVGVDSPTDGRTNMQNLGFMASSSLAWRKKGSNSWLIASYFNSQIRKLSASHFCLGEACTFPTRCSDNWDRLPKLRVGFRHIRVSSRQGVVVHFASNYYF